MCVACRMLNWRGVAVSLALLIVMTACSSPLPIPPYFEAFERVPIHTVEVNGERVAYLDVGQGQPVILIHGFGGSMWQWEHQQQPLSAEFRLITPDLIGSGLSTKPEIEYRPEQMLDYFIGFMDALRIRQVALVGNSMGAGLAIGMALTYPDRVSQLVLIDGLPANVRDDVTATFEAATADPQLGAAVRSGRLVKPLRYAGFGELPDLSDAMATPLRIVKPTEQPAGKPAKNSAAKPPAKKAPPPKKAGPDPAELDAARQRVLDLSGLADDAQRRYDAASRVAGQARIALEQAEKERAEAHKAAREAHAEAERARRDLGRLERS